MTSWREMIQVGKDLLEIQLKGEDFRKSYRTRNTIQLTVKQKEKPNTIDEIINQKTIPMKSYKKGIMALIYAHQSDLQFLGLYDLGKTSIDPTSAGYFIDTTAASHIDGIVVGSNSSSGNFLDHDLNTRILNGSSAGPPPQLDYGATTISALTSPAAGEWSFTMDKDFANNTGPDPGGAVVTVEETGYVIQKIADEFLGERTLTGTVTVDNDIAQSLNVEYKERVVV